MYRDNEIRIQNDRQRSLSEEIERSRRGIPATKRQLVQIYDGGSMPTSGGKWFLGYPVDIDGTEAEGGAATPLVDTSSTIPVLMTSGVPLVGDFIVAHNIGGKWVGEKKCCKVTFNVLCLTVPVAGALVTVMGGTTTIASGTTDSSGNVTMCVLPPGTYTVTATATGQTAYSGSLALTCGGTKTIQMCSSGGGGRCSPPSGYGCCSPTGIPLPLVLYWTVCGTTMPCTAQFAGGYIVEWVGGATVSTSPVAIPDTHPCGLYTGNNGVGGTYYQVAISCPSGTAGSLVFPCVAGGCGYGGTDPAVQYLCPAECGCGGFNTGCVQGATPSFNVTGSISGGMLSASGTMPGSWSLSTPNGCPPPCAGAGITMTN